MGAMVLVPMGMVFLTPTLLLLSQLLSLRLPRLRFLNMSTRLSTRRLSWLLSATMVLDLLSPVPKQIEGEGRGRKKYFVSCKIKKTGGKKKNGGKKKKKKKKKK